MGGAVAGRAGGARAALQPAQGEQAELAQGPPPGGDALRRRKRSEPGHGLPGVSLERAAARHRRLRRLPDLPLVRRQQEPQDGRSRAGAHAERTILPVCVDIHSKYRTTNFSTQHAQGHETHNCTRLDPTMYLSGTCSCLICFLYTYLLMIVCGLSPVCVLAI